MTKIAAKSAEKGVKTASGQSQRRVHLNILSTPKKKNTAFQNRFSDAPTVENAFDEDTSMGGGCELSQDLTVAQFDDEASMDVEHESANAKHTCNNAMIGVEEGTEFPSPPDLIPARGA